VILIELVAGDPDSQEIAVSTTIQVSPGDPRWQAGRVETITIPSQEGARRLRDRLVAQRAIPVDELVPPAALAPIVPAGC